MKRVPLYLLGTLSASIPAFAQNAQEHQQMEEIRESVILENRNMDRDLMWQHVQERNLNQSLLQGPASPVVLPEVPAAERTRKCYPWGWEGGQRNRIAVAMAAELCLSATLAEGLPLEAMKSEVTAMGAADVYAFSSQMQLVTVDARATSPMVGSPDVTASVTVFGNQVWSDAATAPSLEWTKTLELMNFDRSVSQTFLVGPLPASVSVGARGNVTARFAAKLAVANAQASAVPVAKAAGYAFGGLDAGFVKGGVEANINILDDTLLLDGKVGLVIDPSVTPPRLMYAAEAVGRNRLQALDGSVDLVAESRFSIPGIGKSFRFPIFTGEGMTAEGSLFHERIEPTPVRF